MSKVKILVMRIDEYIWHKLLKRPFKLKKIIDRGKGQNVIVLVHGLGGHAKRWDPLVEELKESNYRILAYDLLGFGKSPKPGFSEYSVEEHANSLLKSIREDISSKQKIILIGHSMGCIVSTHIAYKKPKLISNLVLYEPPLLIDSKRRVFLRKSFYRYIAGRPSLVAGYLRFVNKFSEKFSSFSKSNSSDEDWIPFERSLKNTIINQDTVNELKKLKVNTQIIYGRLDFVVSNLDTKEMININPNIKLHYINEVHDITAKSAKFLKNIIEPV